MVNFSSLGVATTETITRFHTYAKTVETAHLGKLYTTVINGINYYVVECAAKPALAKAPEWVSSNRVVNFIQNNKGITILAAGIITLIFIVVMLHPKDDAAKSTGTGSPEGTPGTADEKKDFDVDNAARDGEVKGPDGKDEGEEVEEDSLTEADPAEGGGGKPSVAGRTEGSDAGDFRLRKKDIPAFENAVSQGIESTKVTSTFAADGIARRNRASSAPDSLRGRPHITSMLSPPVIRVEDDREADSSDIKVSSEDEGENASCLNDEDAAVQTPPPARKNGGSSTASTTAVPATEDKKD